MGPDSPDYYETNMGRGADNVAPHTAFRIGLGACYGWLLVFFTGLCLTVGLSVLLSMCTIGTIGTVCAIVAILSVSTFIGTHLVLRPIVYFVRRRRNGLSVSQRTTLQRRLSGERKSG